MMHGNGSEYGRVSSKSLLFGRLAVAMDLSAQKDSERVSSVETAISAQGRIRGAIRMCFHNRPHKP